MTDNELCHYGVKGMKWGVRRYEKSGGSYTKAGVKRFNESANTYDTAKSLYKTLKKNKKEETRLELLIPEDTSMNDIDKIAALALRGKINIFYGLMTPDKPAYWLAILLYMLDGGDIKQEAISWEDKK